MSGTVVLQLAVAESQIQHILLHEYPCTGHLGIEKTYHRAQEQLCWPLMEKDVENWLTDAVGF